MAFHHDTLMLFILALVISIAYAELGYADERPYRCPVLTKFNATSTNPSGDIYSPLYDGKTEYPPDSWCEYEISFPVGYRLKLTFKKIDIDPSDNCNQDKLYIFGDVREHSFGTVCGTEEPEPLIIPPEIKSVRLLFMSDYMSAGTGFHVQYETSPTLEYCEAGMEMCANRKCFNPRTQKCDGVDDCGDGTDEEKCDLPLVTSECGKPPITPDTVYGRAPDRILGGQEATPGSWPWQVSLQITQNWGCSHVCGGTLINAQWVVTAAHCIPGNIDPKNWRIHVGMHHKYFKDPYEQIRYGERIIVYPDVTGEKLTGGSYNIKDDIALLKLNAPVKFNDGVRPACLPSFGWDIPIGSTCYITGWGETRGSGFSDVLKQTDVSFLSTSNCTMYDPAVQICVKNAKGFAGACHGDSGGPLVCLLGDKWYLIGGTSFATYNNMMSGLCAMPAQRTVFMKVSAKAEWIRTMVELYS